MTMLSLDSHKIVPFGVAILILVAAFLWLAGRESIRSRAKRAAAGDAAAFISRNLDFYDKALRTGVSQAEAAGVLPEPNNTNRENVWIWVRDYTPGVATTDWRKLLTWPKNGYFLVIIDGKVATPLCVASEFDPWEALAKYSDMAQPQAADRVLGPKPRP